MVLEKLIDTLMRTAIAQAAAERGLLVLSQGAEPRIEAEATTSSDTVLVKLRDAPVTASALPETVLHYVLRTRESVVLDEAVSEPLFAADPYIRQRQARSIVCLPLINRAKLIGVLYLENNLSARAFASARIAVLKLLASQAAVALENTRLYRDGVERDAVLRSGKTVAFIRVESVGDRQVTRLHRLHNLIRLGLHPRDLLPIEDGWQHQVALMAELLQLIRC